ncbi:MAG: TPR domain protein [Microgenomates group bacterium GW2011_GWA2_44_7]|nr:MAG: TPR domain protein [Microgenomates group bacterium GW2011_GWA2_44_7]
MCMLFDKGLVSRKYSVLLFLPAAGAFLSSFQAVVLPVLLMLYFFAFSSFKKGLKVIWPVWLTTLVFGVSFLTPLFSRVSDFSYDPQGSLIVLNPLIQIPLALVSYLKLILFPVGLTLYHESFYAPTWLLLIYLFGITLYGILSVLCFKKNRIVFFGLVLFPLALAPTLLPIFLNWLVAERYVYLGSLGIILVISYFLLYIKERSKLIFFVLFALVVSSYFILSVKRNFEWKNQDTLWPATVAVSPGSTLAHNNMGDYYARRGDLKSAAKEFGTAVALKPDNANAIHNLGFTYLQMGEATKAAELFDKALTIDPKLIEAAIGLYSVYAQNNDQTKAKAALERAIQINPNAPVVYNVLAVELLKNGQKEEAVRMLRKALEVDPNFLPAKQNLEIVR